MSSQRRSDILAAARRLAARGQPFSMDQLALAAGVSRASLYRHFPSRPAVRAALEAQGVAPGELPKAVHERILDTTAAVLAEGGLEGLTLAGVAARAGVSVATVHRHFDGRGGLLQAFAEAQGVRAQARQLALADDGRPVEQALRDFTERSLGVLRSRAPMLRVLLSAPQPAQEALAAARAPRDGTVHALTVYFRAQQRRGVLRRGGSAAGWAKLYALQLLAHALLPAALWGGPTTDRAAAKALTQLFLDGARA